MALFEVKKDSNSICEITETDWVSLGIREKDIQEWIEKDSSIFNEEILIISKEFGAFDKTNERADLIGLDKNGNIVVIEFKRDNSGADVHWQAVKYASYFRKVSPEDIIKIFGQYKNISIENSAKNILEFLEAEEFSVINKKQRIFLVSHRFAIEVTSAVLWLMENEIDFKCVEIIPYKIGEKIFFGSNTIIPIPGSERFEIKATVNGKEITLNRRSNENQKDSITMFMRDYRDAVFLQLTKKSYRPNKCSKHAGRYNQFRYFKLWFDFKPWENHYFSFQLHYSLYPDENGNFKVSFYLEKSYAIENSLDKTKLLSFVNGLVKFAEEKKFKVLDNEQRFEIFENFHVKINELPENAVQFLVQLITVVCGALEETIEKKENS